MNRTPMPTKRRTNPAERIRLIENWLPFAQSTNELLGWNLDGNKLEKLILDSAPELRSCCTPIEAYTILVSYYVRHSHKEQ